MLITETVKVKWFYKTREHYEDLGYIFTKYYDEFEVPVSHLTNGSHVKIKYKCDYCNDEVVETTYKSYLTNKGNSFIEKDCCKKCWYIKTKETMINKYGVENTSQLESTKLKKERTTLKNYGVKNPSQHPNIYKKQIKTLIKNYGVSNAMYDEGIKSKVFINRAKTLYKNQSAPCSSQQKYIHDIVGGELNYPVKTLNLDIALLSDMIYIEIDGSGHNLQVLIGNKTQDEMDKIERKRWYALNNIGWKEIRIISKKDYFPKQEKVLNMVKYAKDHFNNGHSWICFDIDENKTINSKGEFSYNFGELTRITTKNYKTDNAECETNIYN